MPTLKQLKQQAKARKVSKYSRMNKAQLLSALGMSDEAKAHQTSRLAGKVATQQAVKLSEGSATKRAQIKGRIMRAVKRELDAAKKEGRELSQDEKRAIAGKALAKEIKAIKAGKPEKQKPFKGEKPPHMSVAEYREHLRRKYGAETGSRAENLARKEEKRAEVGLGEFGARSAVSRVAQMEREGKVSYVKKDKSKPNSTSKTKPKSNSLPSNPRTSFTRRDGTQVVRGRSID